VSEQVIFELDPKGNWVRSYSDFYYIPYCESSHPSPDRYRRVNIETKEEKAEHAHLGAGD
jgi:hypothetical protein